MACEGMITTGRWMSLNPEHVGEWRWFVENDLTGQITRGYAADEWLARAHIRVTIKNQQPPGGPE